MDYGAYPLCVEPNKRRTENLKNYRRELKQFHHGGDSITIVSITVATHEEPRG